jgi:predicted metal-dependent peptidase
MDWREILNLKLQSMFKNDYTWSRCSRKGQSSGIYLPGLKEDQRLDVAIAIDSSGSISDKMILDFLGEVKGIMSQFTDYRIHLWCSDTIVYNPQIFTPDNVDEIDTYEIMGRGGNDFNCNWDYMKENSLIPERLIHFTDGYDCGMGFGDPLYCDTTYVIHSDPSRHIVAPAPFMTVYYDG